MWQQSFGLKVVAKRVNTQNGTMEIETHTPQTRTNQTWAHPWYGAMDMPVNQKSGLPTLLQQYMSVLTEKTLQLTSSTMSAKSSRHLGTTWSKWSVKETYWQISISKAKSEEFNSPKSYMYQVW